MDDDYFNEDDLINDYINNDEDEPYNFEDQYDVVDDTGNENHLVFLVYL